MHVMQDSFQKQMKNMQESFQSNMSALTTVLTTLVAESPTAPPNNQSTCTRRQPSVIRSDGNTVTIGDCGVNTLHIQSL